MITTKSHGAAEQKLISIPLTIDRNSWVMTFILTEGYGKTTEREELKSGPIHRINCKKLGKSLENVTQRKDKNVHIFYFEQCSLVCPICFNTWKRDLPEGEKNKKKAWLYHCQWMWHLHWYGNMEMEISSRLFNPVMFSLYYPYSRD